MRGDASRLPHGPKLVLDLPDHIARLQEVEQELAALAAAKETETDSKRLAGIYAHEASLLRRKQWYLVRIRAAKPVQAVGVSVADEIQAGEGMG